MLFIANHLNILITFLFCVNKLHSIQSFLIQKPRTRNSFIHSIDTLHLKHYRQTLLHAGFLFNNDPFKKQPKNKNLIDVQTQSNLLEGTSIDPNKSNVDLQLVYKASRDGWSAINFHQYCDGRGSGLVVVKSQSGKIFGGFNPLGWLSNDDYGNSNAAFLWYLDNAGKTIKNPVLSGGNAVIFDYATGGPQFGSADLVIGQPQAAVMGGFAGPDVEDISSNAGNLREGSSVCGGAYESSKGWPARGKFRIVDVEVYCNGNVSPNIPPQKFSFWPF